MLGASHVAKSEALSTSCGSFGEAWGTKWSFIRERGGVCERCPLPSLELMAESSFKKKSGATIEKTYFPDF